MFAGHMRTKDPNGFILAEILISLLIFIVITAAILTTLKLSTEKITSFLDYRKAAVRIAKANALIKSPVFYCGYGMPVAGGSYKKAFGGQKFDPFRWDGPISAYSGPSGLINSELRITYAMPGSVRLSEMTVSHEDENLIRLDRFPEQGSIGDSFTGCSYDIRNWVLFSSSFPPALPFCITGAYGKTLMIKNNFTTSFSLSKGDRMHHLRALKLYCLNDTLFTRDFRASGDQPRVTGIRDIRFDVDIPARKLTVYVLARGDHIYGQKRPIIGAGSWPKEYIEPWIKKETKYQLYASKTIWRLQNCVGSDLIDLETTSVREHF